MAKNTLFSQFYHLRRLVCDQSSPVDHVSESRRNNLGVMEKQTNKQTKYGRKVLCLILDFQIYQRAHKLCTSEIIHDFPSVVFFPVVSAPLCISLYLSTGMFSPHMVRAATYPLQNCMGKHFTSLHCTPMLY